MKPFIHIYCLSGFLMLFYATHPLGTGISQDSVSYLAAANNFAETGVLKNIDGSSFTQWPPLFPLIIFTLGKLPFPVETSLFWFNILCYVIFLYSAYYLILQMIQSVILQHITMIATVFSFTLLQVYATAYSEGLFVLLVNLSIIFLVKAIKTNDPRDFLWLALVGAAACAQRYFGVFLATAAAVVILFYNTEKGVSRRAVKAVFYLIIFLFPLIIWIVRNIIVAGEPAGMRLAGLPFYYKNSMVMAETITSWVFPIMLPLGLKVSLLLILIIFLLKRSLYLSLYEKTTLIIVAFLIVFTNWAYLLTSFEEPRDRMLSPVFFPFMLLLFSLIDHQLVQLQNSNFRWRNKLYYSVLIGSALWLFYPVIRSVKHSRLWHLNGVDIYNHSFWKNSATIEWIKDAALDKKTFSNDPYAVYYFTGKRCFSVPKKYLCCADIEQKLEEKGYLIWFKNEKFYSLYSIKPLKKEFEIIAEKRMEDGEVFLMINKQME